MIDATHSGTVRGTVHLPSKGGEEGEGEKETLTTKT